MFLRASHRHFAAVVLLIVPFAACSLSSGSGGSGTTSTAPTSTPAPPPHSLAWFQTDSAGVGQIWASRNGGAASQITHFAIPSGECVRDGNWVPPVFSPDMHHIVTSWAVTSCGDIGPSDDVYTVDVSTGAATLVPRDTVGTYQMEQRSEGWIDNNTIWFVDRLAVEQATIGGAPTTLATLGTQTGNHWVELIDGVLRGHTLWYATRTINVITNGSVKYDYALQRFDMSTHATMPGSVNLGSSWDCQCSARLPFASTGSTPGFDVSADGSHIVYQVVTPNSSTTSSGVVSSQFFYANGDGSGASRIASYATAASFTSMQLAPSGQIVAVTDAIPSPTVFTASVSSPGNHGDPGLTFYTTDAGSYPAWNWDGHSFWASGTYVTGNLIQFTVGTPAGVVATTGGHNPWSAIGS